MPVVYAPATRETSGVSTSGPGYLFNNYPQPTPPRILQVWDDFYRYLASDWTVTNGSTGAVAQADGVGGLVTFTTAATNNDIEAIQTVKKSFGFQTGCQVWFAVNVALTNATNNAFMAGLGNDFSALTPTDGVYFSKAAASTTLTAVVRASSTSTTLTLATGTSTMANATAYTLGFYYNGVNRINFYTTIGLAANGFNAPGNGAGYFSGGAQIAGSASSETGATYSLANLPATSTTLVAGAAIKAGTTVAQVATIDYFLASQEVVGRF
jgi:hypothetical protein